MTSINLRKAIYNGARWLLNQVIRRYIPFFSACVAAVIGRTMICLIRKKYGEKTHLLFSRGATGDIYLQAMLFENWLRENHVQQYLIVGDARQMNAIMKLFPGVSYYYVRGYFSLCIEKAFMLWGGQELNMTILFPWTYSLYVNRCRVRMVPPFTFMDTYQWYVFDLHEKATLHLPCFPEISSRIWKKKGVVEGRTVIISPEANSVTGLKVSFWNDIIIELQNMGYQVFVCNKDTKGYQAARLFFNYEQGKSLLEYSGYFLGIRSGLCDIISTAKCRKIILYPAAGSGLDYNHHRTEMDFCGLRAMGLVTDEEDLFEIDSIVMRNITQEKSEINCSIEEQYEYDKLRTRILGCYTQWMKENERK